MQRKTVGKHSKGYRGQEKNEKSWGDKWNSILGERGCGWKQMRQLGKQERKLLVTCRQKDRQTTDGKTGSLRLSASLCLCLSVTLCLSDSLSPCLLLSLSVSSVSLCLSFSDSVSLCLPDSQCLCFPSVPSVSQSLSLSLCSSKMASCV